MAYDECHLTKGHLRCYHLRLIIVTSIVPCSNYRLDQHLGRDHILIEVNFRHAHVQHHISVMDAIQ